MLSSGSSQPTTSPGSDAAGRDDAVASRRVRQFFLLVAVYFGLQIVLRTCISSSSDLDESEQLMLTQKLSWGYGPQPPLYTWLQSGLFAAFGVSIFSMALLKNLLLFGGCVFAYLTARSITSNRLCGVAAAAALFLIPQIAWESQRDLTHSVLAGTLTLATLYCFFQLHSQRRGWLYALFGLCAGLCLLSKYNCVLPLAGLVLAGLSLRAFRPTILDARMLLAGAVALLIFLPHGAWIMEHRDLALRSVSKLHIASDNRLAGIVSGLVSFGGSVAMFLGPLVLIHALILRNTNTAPLQWRSEPARLLIRMLLIVGCFILAGVLFFGVTNIRGRWFQPILICAPILSVAIFQDRINAIRLRPLLAVSIAVMLLVSLAIPGRILLAERMRRTEPLNQPFAEIARQLEKPMANASVIVTDGDRPSRNGNLLGGNLRLNLPDKTCVIPEFAPDAVPPEHCAFAWVADKNAAMPEKLAAFAAEIGAGNATNAPVQYFEATFKYHRDRKMRVAVVLP